MHHKPHQNQQGFTLFEVMIALAIVAIALSASLRAASMSTDSALALQSRTLAGWVAQNRLAEHIALADWPVAGNHSGMETQAGLEFIWREQISPTPSPLFRRIQIDIFKDDHPQHRLYSLTSYLTFPVNP